MWDGYVSRKLPNCETLLEEYTGLGKIQMATGTDLVKGDSFARTGERNMNTTSCTQVSCA
jgi:hypothetical protein